jgi:hypothetical protein
MFRRARHQQGSLQRLKRKSGQSVWIFRWYEIQLDGTKKHRKAVVGTVEEFKTEADTRPGVPIAVRTAIQSPERGRHGLAGFLSLRVR